MNKHIKRMLSYILIFAFLISGFPSGVKVYAAPGNITLSVTYNATTNKYDISYVTSVNPPRTEVRFHGPDGKETVLEDHKFSNNKVTVSTDLLPDHVYDITMNVYSAESDLIYQGKIYYLADMTFTGESFNVMSKINAIEDKSPIFEPNELNPVTVKSGDDPVIRFNWKVPTIYTSGGIKYITDSEGFNLLSEAGVPIAKTCFQINMTVGHGSTRQLNFNTDYKDGNMIVEGTNAAVSGFSAGKVNDDGLLSVTLDKNHGIEPGTEYEFTNIGIIFETSASEQIPVRNTKLYTGSNNRFMVQNIDNAFKDMGNDITSIYTPMQMELTKVDTDKVQVRFKKITNGVYPELYYQVQYAPRIDDLYTQYQKWVKIPDSSLPKNEEYGSEIITITLQEGKHPEYYFRVVYFDSSSELPKSSSLCLDLRVLDVDTGKPPLPKEVKIDPIYAGRKTVTVPNTELSSGEVEIPLTDIRLSIEKPLAWQQITDWDEFKAQDYDEDDYIFHIILSAYMPDSQPEALTKKIGDAPGKEVYLPVKQKRVLVLGKKDFSEDPEDPGRLICTIPGDKLFYDYVKDKPLTSENNEDPSGDGTKGDYPTFLVPNTIYYMQIFTSRYKDNDQIFSDVWGDAEGLGSELRDKLSYTSPIMSFTTWPLTEQPVPMPNINLGIEPATNVDPVTGNITLEGISVSYERILTDTDWLRYTSAINDRKVVYHIFISDNPSTGFVEVEKDEAEYPDASQIINRSVVIKKDGNNEPILPNKVYYIKAHASLVVGGVVIGRSAETAVKAITTPKIDTGGLDNDVRDPRAPTEFSIATDSNGELMLSDAYVTLSWLHAEKDVTYEMVCTTVSISPNADESEYGSDPYNMGLLNAYSEFRNPASDKKLHLDLKSSQLLAIGLTVDENGHVLMPINRDFLRPNKIYFFSLRAVRNRGLTDSEGKSLETVSRWITIPVTTPMIKAPSFLETVRDMEIGFNIQCSAIGTTADKMEVYIKKAGQADSQYTKLTRSGYTCVMDGTTFYFRIYNLESDQWYDVRIRNTTDNKWYDGNSKSWVTSAGNPIKAKTRDGLNEIEVRWEGEDPYEYFLEARAESDVDYETLVYNSSGFTDYGYDLADGTRIKFYREKTGLYVSQKSSKYVYYAKISGKPVRDGDGHTEDLPLKSNTTYYVKVWAYNLDESLHIGPVTARTDFSQADYDDGKKEQDTIDLFNEEADSLTQKMYWLVDIRDNKSVRAIIKDDMVSGLLKAFRGSTVTIDLSGEKTDANYYELLIPYKSLEAVETYDSRLNFRLSGGEVTLNRGSIDFEEIKSQAKVSGAKEGMLLLTIERKTSPSASFPADFSAASDVFKLDARAIGSRLSYAEINSLVYDILNNPDAKGPFKYGILDRELSAVLKNLDSYSYKSHIDLKDMIVSTISRVEVELSRYLKDIIDGGSGYKNDYAAVKGITEFPGRIGIKLTYSFQNGYIVPYVNYGTGWKEAPGAKAYVEQVALFRVEKPGEYVVLYRRTSVIVNPESPFEKTLSKLNAKYDMTKVFGKGTIYPENPVKGEQAIMLYAVLTRQDGEVTGLTPAKKASYLGIGDIIGTKQISGYMDNQSSVSMAVKLYCRKANIDPALMKPSRSIYITNSSSIETRFYKYVVLGVDLNITTLGANKTFDATGRTSIGSMLDMVSRVLEKFEQ